MLPFLHLTILFVGVFSLASPCESGNKWMMDRNRNELVMLNSKILDSLNQTRQNGEVILKGSIVYRDGETILQIHKLEKFTSEPKQQSGNSRLFKENEQYKIFLKQETLHEIQIVDEVKQKP